MGNFAIGCNYWASNAGAYMWRNFDAKAIDKDFALLSSYGVDTIRVFPLWPDFQPVKTMYVSNKAFRERTGDSPLETYAGLDKNQLENFATMLDLAEKYGLKVIVSLITGWMSGRLFVPEILINENPLTSPKAIVWETRFISEFIPRFKDRKCIVAWEPGNECNVLGNFSTPYTALTPEQAELWLSSITNAIRAADNTRPVYAGMHSLGLGYKYEVGAGWDLRMVGNYTDMQTTHPYPLFTPYCGQESLTTMRAGLHAAAESVLYATSSNRPCMVEEIGTLGPMVLSDDFSSEYFEKSLFSSYQYGATGYLWWCGFDQDHLKFSPYDDSGLECNLGLAYDNEHAKPVLEKLKEMKAVVSSIHELPPCEIDISVILTDRDSVWKNAYGAFCMATQAGYSVAFSYLNTPLRKAKNYLIPCISADVNLRCLPELIQEVENGANLLISYDGGHFGSFEKLTGVKVKGREGVYTKKSITLNDKVITIDDSATLLLALDKAETIVERDGNILISRNKLGKGYVYFVNAALENSYTQLFNAHNSNLSEIYRYVFDGIKKPIVFDNNKLSVTYHKIDEKTTTILITNFDDRKEIGYTLADGYSLTDNKYCEITKETVKFFGAYAYLTVKIK